MIRKPSDEEVAALASDLGMDLTDEEVRDYARIVETTLADYETIQDLPEPRVEPRASQYPLQEPGERPDTGEDPHNAWITRCRVEGAEEGPLSGTRVGLKDNIALAGVEMTCGSHLLEGYVPRTTATVVRRLLDAGATVVGKNNMDSFGFSSSGDFSDFGTVTNPHDDAYLAGGSSSGGAAALVTGEVDVALGCDQGGSIRVPAACCGVVGLDPTTGLVPYTGIFPLAPTIDHVGPMARTVEDVARTLEAIAGPDGLDSRQPADLDADPYADAVGADDLSGTTVAVLDEGFEHADSDEAVNDEVRAAVSALADLGAETERVSVPLHGDVPPVAWLVWGYGSLQVFKQAGQGSLRTGWYDTDFMQIFSKCLHAAADTLSPPVKATLLAMEYLDQQQQTTLYGKAQNLRRRIQRRYDAVLSDADVLAMPTIPGRPLARDPELGRVERILRTFPPNKNTCPFVLTDHPSMTVPCGTVDGLPVGLLLVADRFDESTLVRVGDAFERHADVDLP